MNWNNAIFPKLILVVCCVFNSEVLSQKWCYKHEAVPKTRNVLVTEYRVVTRHSWFRGTYQTSEPYTHLKEQTYYVNEIKKVCCDGYESNGNDCTPICSGGCPANSVCGEPDKCNCNEGFSWKTDFCWPICSEGCPANSVCGEPEKCNCDEGFSLENDSCQPICIKECPKNGYCSAPELCSCTEDYELIFNGAEEYCKPICEPTCGANSYCRSPHNCSCLNGYEFEPFSDSDSRVCQPICSRGCPRNSACIRPEECACEDGYEMNRDYLECIPVCHEECPEHSACHHPELCLCDDGYRPLSLADNQLHCLPKCSQDCSPFGWCIAPEQCECHHGYELRQELSKPQCQPICGDGCQHGHCFAPEECVCDPGYLMGPNSTCGPVCSLDCENGICAEPEMCNCSPGYRLADNSVHRCEPICEPACLNGDCVAPNICICWQHHEPLPTHEIEPLGGTMHQCVPTSVAATEYESGSDNSHTTSSLEHSGTTPPTEMSVETSSPNDDGSGSGLGLDSTPGHLFSPSRPVGVCGEQCMCWHKTIAEDGGLVGSTKCEHLCRDDYDQPCLNLTNCRCDLATLQLVCNDSDEFWEAKEKRYSCRLRLTAAHTTDASFAHENTANQSEAAVPWLLIAIAIAVVGLLSIFAVWMYHRQHSNEANLVVDFQS